MIDPLFARLGGYNARGIKPTTRQFTSKFVGVRWHTQRKKWQAYISLGKKQLHLGMYATEDEAARAYDKATLLFVKTGVINLNFSKKDYAALDLAAWYASIQRTYTSKHKHVSFCHTHKRWLVKYPPTKVRRFKTEAEAVSYASTLA